MDFIIGRRSAERTNEKTEGLWDLSVYLYQIFSKKMATKFTFHVHLFSKTKHACCSSMLSWINTTVKLNSGLLFFFCIVWSYILIVYVIYLQPFRSRDPSSASQTCFAWLLFTVSAGKYLFCPLCFCTRPVKGLLNKLVEPIYCVSWSWKQKTIFTYLLLFFFLNINIYCLII